MMAVAAAAALLLSATSSPAVAPQYLMPKPPYRMFSFAYNTTAGGPDCHRDHSVASGFSCSNKSSTGPTVIPTDVLYPPHTYNLLNPAECYNTTTALASWLNQRGVACMSWTSCWNHQFPNTTNDSTVIAHFSEIIASPARNGATAIGMDECGDLAGPKWGHIPGVIPGVQYMALAAQGLRQGRKASKEASSLFVAAWNPGPTAELDGIFSGLMNDHTFDLAMFETYTTYPPYMIHPGGEFQDGNISQWFPRFEYAREQGWLNRSIPCLGMLFGRSAMNPTGWTQAGLRATVQELKDRFPEMPGERCSHCSTAVPWAPFLASSS
jgi:hypothetical protein